MTGLRTLFEGHWPPLKRDQEFDMYPEGLAGDSDVSHVRAFLSDHFRSLEPMVISVNRAKEPTLCGAPQRYGVVSGSL